MEGSVTLTTWCSLVTSSTNRLLRSGFNNIDNNNNNKHKHIAEIFNKLIEEVSIPEWLTEGVTYLIPKNENTGNPKNYRPVTCLPTTYRLITSIISRRMQKYIDNKNLLQKEQKGCSSETKGCKDQLLNSKVILRECKNRKKF